MATPALEAGPTLATHFAAFVIFDLRDAIEVARPSTGLSSDSSGGCGTGSTDSSTSSSSSTSIPCSAATYWDASQTAR
eukprot:8339536-Pyramimonas_sp.AAC.1